MSLCSNIQTLPQLMEQENPDAQDVLAAFRLCTERGMIVSSHNIKNIVDKTNLNVEQLKEARDLMEVRALRELSLFHFVYAAEYKAAWSYLSSKIV